MDDEDMIRELTGTLLPQLGYEVACAADGLEALALYASAQAARQPFVAVILDLTIPGGMGGGGYGPAAGHRSASESDCVQRVFH